MSKWKAKIFDISSIGIADVLSSGIASIFWLYIATTIGPEKYGEITSSKANILFHDFFLIMLYINCTILTDLE